jgi:hypothetical protein
MNPLLLVEMIPTHGIANPYPWYIDPPTHGILTPLPIGVRYTKGSGSKCHGEGIQYSMGREVSKYHG